MCNKYDKNFSKFSVFSLKQENEDLPKARITRNRRQSRAIRHMNSDSDLVASPAAPGPKVPRAPCDSHLPYVDVSFGPNEIPKKAVIPNKVPNKAVIPNELPKEATSPPRSPISSISSKESEQSPRWGGG